MELKNETLVMEYDIHVHWSDEDIEYVALATEWPSLSVLHSEENAAKQELLLLIDDIIAEMREAGETPPTPVKYRTFFA